MKKLLIVLSFIICHLSFCVAQTARKFTVNITPRRDKIND